MLPVTSLLAIALAALFQALSVAIIRRRRGAQVAVGDGGDAALLRIIRAQGNLFEYGVLAVILTALCELNGAPWPWLALLAALFAVGRAGHAYSLVVAEPGGKYPGAYRWRTRGMAITLAVIPLLAVTLAVMLVLAAL